MGTAAAERMQPISDEITSKDRAPCLGMWLRLMEGRGRRFQGLCVCECVWGRSGSVRVPGAGRGGSVPGHQRQRLLWMIKTIPVLRYSTALD